MKTKLKSLASRVTRLASTFALAAALGLGALPAQAELRGIPTCPDYASIVNIQSSSTAPSAVGAEYYEHGSVTKLMVRLVTSGTEKGQTGYAQDVFLGGEHIDLGLHRNGAFGTKTKPDEQKVNVWTGLKSTLGMRASMTGWGDKNSGKNAEGYVVYTCPRCGYTTKLLEKPTTDIECPNPDCHYIGQEHDNVILLNDVNGTITRDFFTPNTKDEGWLITTGGEFKDNNLTNATDTARGQQGYSGDCNGLNLNTNSTALSAKVYYKGNGGKPSAGNTNLTLIAHTELKTINTDNTDRFKITQIVEFQKYDTGYDTWVTISNMTDTVQKNVCYFRGFNPDQPNKWYQGDKYKTDNFYWSDPETHDAYVICSATNSSLPTVTSLDYFADSACTPFYYFAPDPQNDPQVAHKYTITPVTVATNVTLWSSSEDFSTPENGYHLFGDTAMGIRFNIGDLGPGESVRLYYYSSLDPCAWRAFERTRNRVKTSVCLRPQDVANATMKSVAMNTDGTAPTGSWVPIDTEEDGSYSVWSNNLVQVTYTANEDYVFGDALTESNVVFTATTDPASVPEELLPVAIKIPSIKLGAVAQRWPCNDNVDVEVNAKNLDAATTYGLKFKVLDVVEDGATTNEYVFTSDAAFTGVDSTNAVVTIDCAAGGGTPALPEKLFENAKIEVSFMVDDTEISTATAEIALDNRDEKTFTTEEELENMPSIVNEGGGTVVISNTTTGVVATNTTDKVIDWTPFPGGVYQITMGDVTFTVTVADSLFPYAELPTAVSDLVYNGGGQTLVTGGSNCVADVSIVATNAGPVDIHYTPAPGFVWLNGSSEAQNVEVIIAKKSLTITAEDKIGEIGTNPNEVEGFFTFTYDGFVGSDTNSAPAMAKLPTATCAYQGEAIDEESKTYDIVPSGAVAANYSITYVNGTLKVWGKFKITYHALGGKFEDNAETNVVDTFVSTGYQLPDPAPKREDYELIGWYDSWTNGATQVTNNQALIEFKDHTLYAKWESTTIPSGEGETVFDIDDIPAGAEEVTITNAKDGQSVTDDAGRFSVPDRLSNGDTGVAVTKIDEAAFAKKMYTKSDITSLRTSLYLTEIGEGAFNGITTLKSLYVTSARDYRDPTKAVSTKIGKKAFAGTGLEDVYIPETVTDIGISAFQNCSKLKKIVFGGDAEVTYGNYAFYRCAWDNGNKGLKIYMSKAFQSANSALISAIKSWNTEVQIYQKVGVAPLKAGEEASIEGIDFNSLGEDRIAAVTVKIPTEGTGIPDVDIVKIQYSSDMSNWLELTPSDTAAFEDGTVLVEFTVPEGDSGFFKVSVEGN